MSKAALIAAVLGLVFASHAGAEEPTQAQIDEFTAKMRALNWVKGPTTVTVGGNSTLALPEGYVFLDKADTAKFRELNQNLSSGQDVMVAPETLQWSAYFTFEEEGYVKDDEKIDADAILKALQEGVEHGNEERKRRGWGTLQVTGWSIPPAYNNETKRLEWATRLRTDDNIEVVNFFTKVLGRRGFTSVILVSRPEEISTSVSRLNTVLSDYQFNSGETYAEYKPGDKVAQYGLAGLIVGGGIAAAAKSGLLKGLWKFIAIGGAALVAGLKSLFGRKKTDA